MNRLIKLTLLFGTLCMAYSCTDLDEELEDELATEFSDEGVPTPDEGGGASGPLLASYNRLRNGTAGHGSYFSAQEVSSDEMAIGQKGGDWFDGGIWLRMHRHTFGPENGAFNGIWNDAYGGIGEVNLALDGSLSADETAQARVIRAFFYWRLLDNFGRVKIITAPGGDAPQSTRAEVYDFVESELLGALGIASVTASLDLSGAARRCSCQSPRETIKRAI